MPLKPHALLVKQVYNDALSPSMKQLGLSLENVTKSTRFLFAGFDYLAAHQERWQRYLKRISERVEEEDLTEGHPQIFIPAMEGLSMTYEGSLVGEMFINLLTNSIDKNKQVLSHPAFPTIIQQLSQDEAVILYYLKKRTYKVKFQYDFKENIITKREILEDEFPVEKLSFPGYITTFMDHLNSLDLAGTYDNGDIEVFTDDNTGEETGVQTCERRLEHFGKFFAESCVPDKFENL